jgi:hypothetical protein
LKLVDFESIKLGAYTAPEMNSSRSDRVNLMLNPKMSSGRLSNASRTRDPMNPDNLSDEQSQKIWCLTLDAGLREGVPLELVSDYFWIT